MMSARVHGSILACVLLIAGCAESRKLMPTPNLYTDEKATLFEALPQEYTSTLVELIYATDRVPETDEAGNLRYGFKRSNSLAFGTTVVDLGQNTTWDDLVEASRTHTRFGDFELRLVSIDEFGRLPPTPTPYQVIDGEVVEDPEAVAALDASAARLQAEVRRRLALTPRKDAYIYVHGYHNTFEDAMASAFPRLIRRPSSAGSAPWSVPRRRRAVRAASWPPVWPKSVVPFISWPPALSSRCADSSPGPAPRSGRCCCWPAPSTTRCCARAVRSSISTA